MTITMPRLGAAFLALSALVLGGCSADAEDTTTAGGAVTLSAPTSPATPSTSSGSAAAPTSSGSAAAPSSSAAGSAEGPTVVPVVGTDADDVELEEQTGDGQSAVVEEVDASEDGWIAVLDASGAVLGATAITAGENRNVVVPLTTPLTESVEITALLTRDDGDGAFDLALDPPVQENSDDSDGGDDSDVDDDGDVDDDDGDDLVDDDDRYTVA